MDIIAQSLSRLLRSIEATNAYTLSCLKVSLQKNLLLKNNIFSFLLFDSKDKFTMKHETTKQDNLKKDIISKKRQTGSFLNRCNFPYACRDTVNQLGKTAPEVIKNASAKISNIIQQRIQQAISQGGKEIKRVLPSNTY